MPRRTIPLVVGSPQYEYDFRNDYGPFENGAGYAIGQWLSLPDRLAAIKYRQAGLEHTRAVDQRGLGMLQARLGSLDERTRHDHAMEDASGGGGQRVPESRIKQLTTRQQGYDRLGRPTNDPAKAATFKTVPLPPAQAEKALRDHGIDPNTHRMIDDDGDDDTEGAGDIDAGIGDLPAAGGAAAAPAIGDLPGGPTQGDPNTPANRTQVLEPTAYPGGAPAAADPDGGGISGWARGLIARNLGPETAHAGPGAGTPAAAPPPGGDPAMAGDMTGGLLDGMLGGGAPPSGSTGPSEADILAADAQLVKGDPTYAAMRSAGTVPGPGGKPMVFNWRRAAAAHLAGQVPAAAPAPAPAPPGAP